KGFYFNPFTTSGKFYGASIETVCHEIGHGIWDTLVGRRSDDLQSQTLNEGFGDVIGAMAEMSVRGYPGPNEGGWCMFGDEFTNQTCGHNFKTPKTSSEKGCLTFDANSSLVNTQCPKDYDGPDYCTFSNACIPGNNLACCDVHRNATVLEHWFYLLANGDQAVNAASCPYR